MINEYAFAVYRGKRVLVTGHTGFKGSWLCCWLSALGAKVTGYSLDPPSTPNHFSLLHMDMDSIRGDVRSFDSLAALFGSAKPEIVFHLAAQPLVRRSYQEPLATLETNVLGTANILEATRLSRDVRAVVIITSDKCYANQEWVWGYREIDPMGGHDPYSASKGCAELVTSSWRNSYFPVDLYGVRHQTLVASARAGNVMGGGDWGEDRLIPDLVRAAVSGKPAYIRHPEAVRPWQHVLDPLSGYLLLGQKLLEGKKEFSQAWNFGPADEDAISVGQVVRRVKQYWDTFDYVIQPEPSQPHEAYLLRLDSSKARAFLGWEPVWDTDTNFEKTISWYKSFYEQKLVLTSKNLIDYIQEAKLKQICWAVV